MRPLLTRQARRAAYGFSALAAVGLASTRFASSSTPAMAGRAAALSVQQYTPRHTQWPYSVDDMRPSDDEQDDRFYSQARYVTHIDDEAIADLRTYYASTLPSTGRILDLCSSWISHFPPQLEQASQSGGQLKVIGLGMHQGELNRNPVLSGGRIVHDLNASPGITESTLGLENGERLDATVCVVSIDYLTKPVDILKAIRNLTRRGGSVHLIISNRCFPTKAVKRWLHVDEDERLAMVGDYLHFSGWSDIEILTLSDGQSRDQADDDTSSQGGQSTMRNLMRMMGMGGRDPLWVVRAVNNGAQEKSEL